MLDSNSVLFSNCLSLLLLTKKRVQVLGPAQTKNEKQQSSHQNKLFLGNVQRRAELGFFAVHETHTAIGKVFLLIPFLSLQNDF